MYIRDESGSDLIYSYRTTHLELPVGVDSDPVGQNSTSDAHGWTDTKQKRPGRNGEGQQGGGKKVEIASKGV